MSGNLLSDHLEVLMFRSEQGINKSGTQIMKPWEDQHSNILQEFHCTERVQGTSEED
jgi:hypothetical protein